MGLEGVGTEQIENTFSKIQKNHEILIICQKAHTGWEALAYRTKNLNSSPHWKYKNFATERTF